MVPHGPRGGSRQSLSGAPARGGPGGRECAGGGADAQDAGDQVLVRVGARVGPSVSGNPLRGGIVCPRVRERQGARVQGGGLDGAPLARSADCGLSGEEEEKGMLRRRKRQGGVATTLAPGGS